MTHARAALLLALGLLLGGLAPTARALAPGEEAAGGPAPGRRYVKDGVAVDFSLERVAGAGGQALLEGDFAEVRFRMTDAASGKPVAGLAPSAWLDMAGVVAGRGEAQRECKDRISLYLKGIVGIRPLVDLNSYYLLVLNHDASISVIDPVVSMTGNTSLYATVTLRRPGADWVQAREARRLFVSMPKAGRVAVVDTEAFKVERELEAGVEPTRLALQPDGRYLWVGDDAGDGGVVVLDAVELRRVGQVATGRGHHEIAFSGDGRHAFVTNRASGTVSVIEVASRRKVKDLAVGAVPISVARSSLSGAVYVADGKGGAITVIDPERLTVTATIATRPGLGPLRFSPDGRWGFVVNPAENGVVVVDASSNRVAHELSTGGKPYQVAFTRSFAYLRLLDSAQFKLVNLSTLGEGKTPTVQSIGAGTGAPMAAGALSMADSVTPAAAEAAVFVLNPADGNSYFYMEGMNAPSGSFGSYGHRAAAVAVVDRSLKEVEPGVYAGRLRVPAAGRYDVALLLDNPRLLHCFTAEAGANPALGARVALRVEHLADAGRAAAGAPAPLRFRLLDARTGEPRTGLADVEVATYAVPGRHRMGAPAREVAPGTYQADVRFPAAGIYYVFVAVPSLEIAPRDVAYRSIEIGPAGLPGAAQEAPRDPHASL